ncbi:MAG: trypsin-like peptidase domain-containing protein [Sulfuricurvum sp.]|jgi:serine protease Do|uniref:S1C family serine protease n=1 Tax=Sulfuricurvum sp. TaxID=2025608 RepID=UPI0025F74382|nr:trypsin-like peptidase domain-containing protein [Sulfuricurvum sp.]MCK9373635.1 trypsin-like peptidase domain-containing protein [Sulfuricurvum sp.]
MLTILLRNFIIITTFTTILSAFETFFSISEQVKNVSSSVIKIKVNRSNDANTESDLISTDRGGSGFVFDANHHVVTNAHVIGDAKKIIIIDENNTEYPAVLIGQDDKTDVAVLEVSSFNTPNVSFADANSLSAGDGVFVIGAPFSLGNSVSAGIVSAINRFLPNYPYVHFIQTDSAINPGNSGGPIFNLNGKIIGMTSTQFTRQGEYTNIGFALPIDKLSRIAEQLIAKQKIERGYLGAELLISERISRKMGYQFSVLITRIDPKSPAIESGLKTGDIIIGINNEVLHDSGELHRFLENSRPSDTLTLTYVRNKQSTITTVHLGSIPIKNKEITNIATADQAEKLGLVVRENNSNIEVIMTYGIAKMVGIDPKDTIIGVNSSAVNTIKELNTQLIATKETDIAFLTIQRDGKKITLPIGSKSALRGYTTEN